MTLQEQSIRLQDAIWDGSVPLDIRLSPQECRIYDSSDSYFVSLSDATLILQILKHLFYQIQYPRLSYLPFLLPRLHAFFKTFLIDPDVAPHGGWFSYEDVPLKWHYPLGLLYDVFSGAPPAQINGSDEDDHRSPSQRPSTLPWRLTLHFADWPGEQLVQPDAEGKVLHDAFINSVKEADFLRNGTAKGIMSLSKDDSTQLWNAVQQRMATHSPFYRSKINIVLSRCPFGFRSYLSKIVIRPRRATSPCPSEDLPSLIAIRLRTFDWSFKGCSVPYHAFFAGHERAANARNSSAYSFADLVP